jgi:hypothetical protein
MDQGGDPSSYPSSGNWLFEETRSSNNVFALWQNERRRAFTQNLRLTHKGFNRFATALLLTFFICFNVYTLYIIQVRYFSHYLSRSFVNFHLAPEMCRGPGNEQAKASDWRQHTRSVFYFICLYKIHKV